MTIPTIEMFLSSNVRFLLDRAGWSGAELARRANCPKQYVTDILSGRNPRVSAKLKRIADAFGIDGIDSLIFTDLRKLKAKDGDETQQLVERLMGGKEVSGVFKVTLKRLPDRE